MDAVTVSVFIMSVNSQKNHWYPETNIFSDGQIRVLIFADYKFVHLESLSAV